MVDHMQYIEALKKFERALPLSYTKGKTLHDCPLKYSRQYLEGAKKEEPPDKGTLVVGNFIHKVLESCTDRCNQFGWYEDGVPFGEVWRSLMAQRRLTLEEYARAESLRLHTEEIFSRVMNAVNKHGLKVSNEMVFVMNQKGMMRTATHYLKRFFFGFIDVYAETRSGERAMVIDYKTGANTEAAKQRTNEQLSNYVHYLFLRSEKLNSVQFGGAYIPDEDIDLGGQVIRGSNEHKEIDDIVEDFYRRYIEALETTTYQPTPSIVCNWCNYTYSCPEKAVAA